MFNNINQPVLIGYDVATSIALNNITEDLEDLRKILVSIFMGHYFIKIENSERYDSITLPWWKRYKPLNTNELNSVEMHSCIEEASKSLLTTKAEKNQKSLSKRKLNIKKETHLQIKIQLLVVKTMQFIEYFNDLVFKGQFVEAMPYVNSAYKSHIDTVQILSIFADKSKRASQAADKMHSEDKKFKADAFDWLDENYNNFSSNVDVYEGVMGYVICKESTAVEWVKKWKKQRILREHLKSEKSDVLPHS